MSRLFYHVCQDNAGNLLFDVSGTMRLAGSGTLATIYGDEALTVILPNPMTNHPSFGSFKCYLGASASGYDFYMAKAGYTFETLTGVQGLGTMAQQDADAVAIEGGQVVGPTRIDLNDRAGNDVFGIISRMTAGGGTNRFAFFGAGNAPSAFSGPVGIQTTAPAQALHVGGGGNAEIEGTIGIHRAPASTVCVYIDYLKASMYGIVIHPTDNDAGANVPILFQNVATGIIGSISATATATAYNTSSDSRLKHAIAPLTGALDVVRRLRPVSFLWNADGSPGRGFLAGEVQEVVDGLITGERDAVDDDGRIVPQQIDYSKLVPWLTAALQEAVAQVQALTARVATLEDGLGV